MKIVKCGVTQGSIIGPLLFLIFVNDFNNSTKVLEPVSFADNTNLICSDNNIRTLLRQETKNWAKLMIGFLQINYP